MREEQSITGKQVALGCGLGIALHLLLLVLLVPLQDFGKGMTLSTGVVFLYLLWNPGFTQLVYQVPVYLVLRRKGKQGMARGIVIAASLTVLVNATCWGVLMLRRH